FVVAFFDLHDSTYSNTNLQKLSGEKVQNSSKDWARSKDDKKQGFKVDAICFSKETRFEFLVCEYTRHKGGRKDKNKDIEKIIKEMQLLLQTLNNKGRAQNFSQENLRRIRVIGINVSRKYLFDIWQKLNCKFSFIF